MDTIWPRSEPFVLTEDVAFIQAIDPATERIIGVAVVDISRPDAPVHTATIPDTFLEKLYTDGNRLFGETKVGTNKFETHVYNIQGASRPAFVGSSIPGQVIYSDSQYAVLLRQGSLKTIDLTNPDNGVFPEVGGYSGADALLNVTTSGVLAYAGINNGIKILSLGTPTSPAELGALHFNAPRGAVQQIAVFGSYAYVKTAGGLIIVDVTDPGSPTEMQPAPIPGFTGNLQIAGSLLYTANSDGLHVYSLAAPLSPVEAGYFREETGGQWMQIQAAGTTVYAAVRYNVFPGEAELRSLRFTDAPSLNLQAEGPNVTVNGIPLAPGSAQTLGEGDVIEISGDEGQASLQLRCTDVLDFLNFLMWMVPDNPPGGSFPTLNLVLLAAAVVRACSSSALAATPEISLTLALEEGGLGVVIREPTLQMTVMSPEVAINSLGVTHFHTTRSNQGQTTTVISRFGNITVTPQNTDFDPFDLHSGEKVEVSLTAVGPVTKIPNWLMYFPLTLEGAANREVNIAESS
ncbi:MAG: hypothetical protein J5I90_04865 [Caldilineales bacterium]|nr:hypothetical protein [Caldilineales bacterium]